MDEDFNDTYVEWAEYVIWDDKYWQSQKNVKNSIKLPDCEDLDIPY